MAPVLARAESVRAWSDERLVAEQRAIAAERRRLDARAAVVAAEIVRRVGGSGGGSDPVGSGGSGSATQAEVAVVQRLTGGSTRETRALIEVGRMAAAPDAVDAWLRPVRDAVASGALSVEAAQAIRVGLGDATGIPPASLSSAVERLIADAARVPVERLAARARIECDLLDERGVAEREASRRARRFLRLTPLDDGMTRISGLLDTESAAQVRAAFDAVTAPRRSGPRFVTPTERARAASITDDPRTTEQLLADRFVELVERAVAADDGTIFGARRPGVRVHVALRDLVADGIAGDAGNPGIAAEPAAGSAQLEGAADAVSVATASRIACVGGVVPIVFDERGAPLDVGRTQRLHTVRQRIAIAARDGGCRWPDCDRPPGWTEVHHPIPWSAGGGTSVGNGVSLCAHHHLRVHNEGWRVVHEASGFWLLPPPVAAGARARIPMPSRNRIRLDGTAAPGPPMVST